MTSDPWRLERTATRTLLQVIGFVIRLPGLPQFPDDRQPAIGQDPRSVGVRVAVRPDLPPVGAGPARLRQGGQCELLGDAPELLIAAAPELDAFAFPAALGDRAGAG